MILEQKKTNIAYRCPECSCAATGFVGSFSLSADMLKLKCPCKGSEMSLTYTGREDKKIRLAVPCMFCGKDHNYVVSQSVFFNSDLFLLECPYTHIDICFIGKEEKLSEAIESADKDLNALFEEVGIQSLDQLKIKGEKVDEDDARVAEVYDVVRYLVSELKDEGAIDCPCHSGSYDFEFNEDGIRVFCTECGAEYVFCATSVSAAQDFLSCDRLDLK